MSNHTIWMVVSAIIGASCFVIIHFTKLLKNPTRAAVLQLSANSFVFLSWGAGFLAAHGLAKLFAFGGVVVPVIMATITVCKVLRARRQP